MKAATGLLLALLAVIGIGIANHLLVPVETSSVGVTDALRSSVLPKGDTVRVIYLSALSLADTVYRADDAQVRRGDTLGASITDPYRYLRADLAVALSSANPAAALREVAGATATEIALAGEEWRDKFLSTIEGLDSAPPLRAAAARRSTPRYSFEERELLSAGKMGAEDGIRDLEGKLRFLSPPSSDAARERVLAIAQQISVKRAYVAEVDRKLALTTSRKVVDRPVATPTLTDDQRARIMSLTAELRPDTSYLMAPVAGRFTAPAQGRVAQLSAEAPKGTLGISEAASGAAANGDAAYRYGLEPTGLPVLWATAKRVSADGEDATLTPQALMVRPAPVARDSFRQLRAPLVRK